MSQHDPPLIEWTLAIFSTSLSPISLNCLTWVRHLVYVTCLPLVLFARERKQVGIAPLKLLTPRQTKPASYGYLQLKYHGWLYFSVFWCFASYSQYSFWPFIYMSRSSYIIISPHNKITEGWIQVILSAILRTPFANHLTSLQSNLCISKIRELELPKISSSKMDI